MVRDTLMTRGLTVGAAAASLWLGWSASASHGGLPSGDAASRLIGRWAGQGTVLMVRGGSESFQCVVNYLAVSQGGRVRQNLRCHNANNRIDAATNLVFEGTRVSGQWADNIHNLEGAVTGELTPQGFRIHLSGQFFQADMDVSGLECEQSVTVEPRRGGDDIRVITAALRRC